MAVKKRGLGRGLDALLGNPTSNETEVSGAETEQLLHLPIEQIQRGQYQPRRNFDSTALEELAESIKSQGLMQPIVVRPISGDSYEIIAGERRWRAAQLAMLPDMPVIVKVVSDQTAMAMGLIENIQRENLNAVEEATALNRLQSEFKLTQQQVAESVGKSRATVANLIRLLALNDDVLDMLSRGEIEMGHGRALLALQEGDQSRAAQIVSRRKLSVRQTEALVRSEQQEGGRSAKKRTDPNIQHLEQQLGDQLGSSVSIQAGKKGKGKLVISYNSTEELEGILSHIK